MIGLVDKSLGRKDIVEILYSEAFRFLKIVSRRENLIIFKEVHLSPSLRADILSLSWKDKVTVIELKTCREDFEKDEKWQKYMDFCDYFWFMCPEGVIKEQEIPENVGLIYVSLKSENPYFTIKKRPSKLKPKYINGIWFKNTYKKLAFRKNALVNGESIDLDTLTFFK